MVVVGIGERIKVCYRNKIICCRLCCCCFVSVCMSMRVCLCAHFVVVNVYVCVCACTCVLAGEMHKQDILHTEAEF